MNIKIYHLGKAIFLATHLDDVLLDKESHFVVYQLEELVPTELFDITLNDEYNIIVLLYKDLEALKNAFFGNFTQQIAAGGVVENESKEVLWIFRRQTWDLPKGKWDDDETIEDCALREIEEETGVNNLNLQHLLLKTYHTFIQDKAWILKETYWYYVKTTFNLPLMPQAEEQIEKVEWVNSKNMMAYINTTFPSIKDVVMAYNKLLL